MLLVLLDVPLWLVLALAAVVLAGVWLLRRRTRR
jgi:MYXO-CTERM domain-containing protein